MGNIAIEFVDVGKLYRLGQVGTGTLSNDLNRWWKTRILGREDPYLKVGETNDRSRKGNSDFVWALQDINLDVGDDALTTTQMGLVMFGKLFLIR